MQLSFTEIAEKLRIAIMKLLPTPANGDDKPYIWLQETYADYVVYEIPENGTFRRAYSIQGEEVLLGEAVQVEKVYIVKNSLDITIASLEGITQVDVKPVDPSKGISAVFAGDVIVQYQFDLDNKDAAWTPDTAAAYIQKTADLRVNAVLQAVISEFEPVTQAQYLPDDRLAKLKGVDADPFFVPLHIKYGVGSNKQAFDKAFFETAGAKFEGMPFFINHSDLSEFGKANAIGSIVKFAGADEDQATFIAYVSASEGTLRQKIRESQALGDKGFVRKVSIEGVPKATDFRLDKKTGIKHFHDLAFPTGIAIVNLEGLKGSAIGG